MSSQNKKQIQALNFFLLYFYCIEPYGPNKMIYLESIFQDNKIII